MEVTLLYSTLYMSLLLKHTWNWLLQAVYLCMFWWLGWWQFRALSDQLYRSPEHHKFVRDSVVKQVSNFCLWSRTFYCCSLAYWQRKVISGQGLPWAKKNDQLPPHFIQSWKFSSMSAQEDLIWNYCTVVYHIQPTPWKFNFHLLFSFVSSVVVAIQLDIIKWSDRRRLEGKQKKLGLHLHSSW
jgi:hypothetical protein